MQTDQYGFKYYEWPSEKWRKCKSIWEFVELDPESDDLYRVKLGTPYILYSTLREVYEIYYISEHTRDTMLIPFIKQERLFVLS